MKKITSFLIIIVCAFATTAQVQRTKIAKQQADSVNVLSPATQTNVSKPNKKKNRELFKELDLSRTQMKQLKEMRQETKLKKAAIENNNELSDTERKQQLKEYKKGQLKKLQQILTPEQLSKLKTLRKGDFGEEMGMDEMDN